MQETVFSNARIVLPDRVVDGTVVVSDGCIAEIGQGRSAVAGAIDLEGDLLIPGLVELHTDNLEKHMRPRPGADWPSIAAVAAHDSQVAGSGITTVLDAIAIGDFQDGSLRLKRLQHMIEALDTAHEHDLLKSDHMLHLRCEIGHRGMPAMLDPLLESHHVRLLSVMDHTPGQRQFASLESYRAYYQGHHGLSDADMEALISSRIAEQKRCGDQNRRHVVAEARRRCLPLASHDDGTAEHVSQAAADGMVIAEFPTTVEAARLSHEQGLAVMMGGPNLVRGGSHNGNVSALELAEAGYLDIISSDYAPASLLHAAMLLTRSVGHIDLPRAIATITRTPARAAGMDDRGEIATGQRADLVQVRDTPFHPLIMAVWRSGRRIA